MTRTITDHTPGARLRKLMDSGVVAAPGAFNALVARAVADAGFDAAYFSGGAISVAKGVPDVGVLTLTEFAVEIERVCTASALPVIADADTGFGEAEMVRRSVFEYARAGAAGFHIEDQVFPKRCGHLDGKELIATEDMADKVRWAAKASQDFTGGDFIVCARTDAKGVDGMDAAIERAKAYVHAGADMIFPEGLGSEDEFETFAKAMASLGDRKPYLLANMTEFGKTPILPLTRFGELGYDLVIYPVTTLRIAMGAVTDALKTLKAEGHVENLLGQMQTRKELYGLVGYTPGTAWEM